MKTPVLMFAAILAIPSLASAIPNPAAQFCVNCGYKSQIRTDPQGGQYGVCVFPDGSECDEWDYFRKCHLAQCGDCNCPWPCPKRIIYVDDDANGLNNGSSWQNAYKFLQDALMMARDGDELRVAQGIYKPDEFAFSDRPNLGRAETFQLKNGVAIRGGYAGMGQPDPNTRDVNAYTTVLSGDLAGNDNLTWPYSVEENSNHVVTGTGTDSNAILDGFTITAGNAYYGAGVYNYKGNPSFANCVFSRNRGGEKGGGMYNECSSPTLTNCTFSKNAAWRGGGVYNYHSNPSFANCLFIENNANPSLYLPGEGGGMSNVGSSPTLTQCTFTLNSAMHGGGIVNYAGSSPILNKCDFEANSSYYSGGGVYNSSGSDNPISPIFIQCTFRGNRARKGNTSGKGGNGGGMFNGYYSAPQVNNCTFSENSAKQGGAICNISFGTTALDNCIFIGNSASADGGGLYTCGGTTSLINCTFAGNWAVNGNSIACGYAPYIPPGPPPRKIYCSPSTIRATNCIFWEQRECIGQHYGSIINIRYSNIQGGWPGEGNIDVDPCFADPGYWDQNGTLQDPNDDFWVDGDYHLKSQAGRWNPNGASWVKDDVTSPCIDAGDPTSPVGLEPFPNGGRINMGAYGGTIEASKSYFGEPVCETIIAGDINGDCKVDLWDLAIMTSHWLEEN